MEDTGYIYYDDSKHPDSGFYLGAFIYSNKDVNASISKFISYCGLDPDKDEFKSGLRMDNNPEQKELRTYLKTLLHDIQIFVVLSPPDDNEFKVATRNGLVNLIKNNQDRLKPNLNIFLDQGIFNSKDAKDFRVIITTFESNVVILNVEQNSIKIKGIQLADLVAHTCSIMLKELLGLTNKTIKAGDNSGYDPDMNIKIGFELWSSLRYNFFSTPPPHPEKWESQLDCVAIVDPKGLYISDNCIDEVKIKGKDRFGEMYLGCIH